MLKPAARKVGRPRKNSIQSPPLEEFSSLTLFTLLLTNQFTQNLTDKQTLYIQEYLEKRENHAGTLLEIT